MKNKIYSFIIVFFIAISNIQAQDGKLNFTIYAGLAAPKLSYQLNNASLTIPTIGNNNGYTFGVRFATTRNLNQSNIAVSGIGGLSYQQAGATISNNGLAGIKEVKLRFNYGEVNTMVGIGIGPTIPKLVEFQIGLAAGYALSGQSITSYTNGTDSTTTLKFGDSKANGKSYKDFNFGLKMGLSFNISKLNIAAYYFSGFSDISNNNDVTIKNKNFNITLGYTINLMSSK